MEEEMIFRVQQSYSEALFQFFLSSLSELRFDHYKFIQKVFPNLKASCADTESSDVLLMLYL